MTFEPGCLATGIGSLPYLEPSKAVDTIFANMPEIPFWPQLPKKGIMEGMIGQFGESLPALRYDKAKDRYYFDTTSDLSGELEIFYQRYLDKSYSSFSISDNNAAGLHEVITRLRKERPLKARYIKGQITGPITFGTAVKDETGKDIIHNDLIFDVVKKGLAMKGCWQVGLFKELGFPAIIFLDEPGLVSIGSAYSSLGRDDIIKTWNETADLLHQEGAVVGIHCCGNTDWSLLFESKTNIISFDAYGFMDKIFLYAEGLQAFLSRGGILAWGIVPTTDTERKETAEDLVIRIDNAFNRLASLGIDKGLVFSRSLITPSCGMGLSEIDKSVHRLELASKVSSILRGKNSVI